MIESVKLQNFLSFGANSEEIALQPLNIIIGPNGSGKSNLLEAFDLLRNAPSDITKPIREGGGVSDWLYKGNGATQNAEIRFVIRNTLSTTNGKALRYLIGFNAVAQKFEIVDEQIDEENCQAPYYHFNKGKPILNIGGKSSASLKVEGIDTTQSILAQKRDSIHYPEITFLAHEFARIKLYREWSFGRNTPARLPQKVDLPNDFLDSDCSNLCLVLNQIRNNLETKKRLLKELQAFYGEVEDYEVTFNGGQAQIFFQERGLRVSVPSTRLSDGTLRYLCLLAILCHPTPPPVVCIEEPELGLHPDVIPNLAKLLSEASGRCQLIVTTHSEILIDAFTEHPEAVIVAEKNDDGTQLARLNKDQLKPWLEEYRLGKLWARGDIGGTRW